MWCAISGLKECQKSSRLVDKRKSQNMFEDGDSKEIRIALSLYS